MDKELLLRYIEGFASIEEKIEVTNWLDAHPDNMKEYLTLRKLHDIMIWQQAATIKSEEKKNGKSSIQHLKSIYSEVLKIAAVLLVAFLGSWYFFTEFRNQDSVVMQTLRVPAGQRAEITLVDGTKVWLNAKTTLLFPSRFTEKNREVKIDGEGFFEVTANKSQPFIVKTNRFDVKVWGTKFNLMAYSEKNIFETSLLEGSVEVMKSNDTQGVMIKPDERISFVNNQLVVAPIIYPNHFLWREGIISFNDESFPELVSKLELYFDMKVEVKNDKILDYRCTGKFRTKDGVEHILKVLQLSNKFSFKIDEKMNVITIK